MSGSGGGGGTDIGSVDFTWTEGESTVGAKLELWESSNPTFSTGKGGATKINEFALGITATTLSRLTGSVWYYWLRYRLPTGDLGTAVPCVENPITYPPPAPL